MSDGTDFDVSQLDLAARCLNGEDSSMTTEEANQILCDFKADTNSYLFVRPILEGSSVLLVKNTVFQALISSIEKSWKCMEENVQEEIRQFLFEFVIKSPLDMDREISYKGRRSLIAILDHIYTTTWKHFLLEAWDFTEGNPDYMTNYMLFISDFFGHVINDAPGKITKALSSSLENCIRQNGLRDVMYCITEILNNSEYPPYLARASLEAMSFCVKWRFPFDLFESTFFSNLVTVFLGNPDLAIDSVKVLANIAARITFPEGHEVSVIQIFGLIMNALSVVTDNNEGSIPTPQIGANFIEALTTIFDHYGYIIDSGLDDDQFGNALQWAWGITISSDGPLFELTFEFWQSICERLVLNFGQGITNQTYLQYAPNLRRLIIERMPIPFAITQTVDVFGNTAKKVLSGTEISNGYALMRRCLAMLTKIDQDDTISAFEERYQELIEAANFSMDKFGAFCWAVAATSGSFDGDHIEVIGGIIQELANLINNTEIDDDDRVHVGLGFMYICSEYNKYVSSSTEGFIAVMKEIISLAISENKDLQTIGIDTVNFMARRCRDAFFQASDDEASIYDQILSSSGDLYSKMMDNDGLVNLFNIFSNLTMYFKPSTGMRRTCMETFIQPVNNQWSLVSGDFDPSDGDSCRAAVQALNIFSRVPVNLADEWASDFHELIPGFMDMYQRCINFLQETLPEGNQDAIQDARSVTAAIITVAHNFLYGTSKPLELTFVVGDDFFEMLMDFYVGIEPPIRVPQTVDFFATMIVRYESEFMALMPDLFGKVYSPTIQMIRDDFDAFAEFRPELFRLMMAIVNGCPQFLLGLGQSELVEFVECAKWGCQHPQEEVSRYSFTVLQSTINMIIESKDDDAIAFFYNVISVETTIFILEIVTNVTYKFAIDEASRLFHFLLKLPSLFDEGRDELLNQRIGEEFSDQDPTIFTDLIQRVRVNCTTEDDTTQAVKDFLVRVREISPFDPQIRIAEASARLKRLNDQHIAGMISEHEQQLKEEPPDDATLRFMEQIKNMHIHKQ